MSKRSAGILMHRTGKAGLEVLLVHPGGPFWAKRDAGAWSIPKGEHPASEDPLAVAIREFEEETGLRPCGPFRPLGEITQPSRKVVVAWAVEGDFDPRTLKSNTFELEWPPRSGRRQTFPEVDRAEWFAPDRAHEKILPAQRPFIMRLMEAMAAPGRSRI
jgi:predicted NUDIX family NTP pyrophosphohydrolase